MLILAAAIALQTAAPEPVIIHIQWIRRPEIVGRAEFAQFIGLPSATVSMSCVIDRIGPPETCEILSALPEGLGYEEIALVSIKTGELSPRTVDGRTTSGRFRTSFNFGNHDGALDRDESELPPADSVRLSLARKVLDSADPDRQASFKAPPIPADVAPDRQAEVQRWLTELIPIDPKADREAVADLFARTFTVDELTEMTDRTAFLIGLERLTQQPMIELRRPGSEAASTELRRRYCARYDCRQPEWD